MSFGPFFGQGLPPGLFNDPALLKALARSQQQQAAGHAPVPMLQLQNTPQFSNSDVQQAALLSQHQRNLVASQQAQAAAQASQYTLDPQKQQGGFLERTFGNQQGMLGAGIAALQAATRPGGTLGDSLMAAFQTGAASAQTAQAQRQAIMVGQAFQQGDLPAAFDYLMAQGDVEQAQKVMALMASETTSGFTLEPGQMRIGARDRLYKYMAGDGESPLDMTPQDRLKVAREIQDDLRAEIQNQGVNDVVAFYQNGKQGVAMNNAFGDVLIVQAMAKLNDPGSIVREGEFRVWGERMGFDEKMLFILEKLDTGRILDATQRDTLNEALEDLFETRRRRFAPLYQDMEQQLGVLGLEDLGLSPDVFLVDPFAIAVEPRRFVSAGLPDRDSSGNAVVSDGGDVD